MSDSEMLVYLREAHYDVVVPPERAYRLSIMQTAWPTPQDPDADRYAIIILEPAQSTFLDLSGNAQRVSHRMDQLQDWAEATQTGLHHIAELELQHLAETVTTHQGTHYADQKLSDDGGAPGSASAL